MSYHNLCLVALWSLVYTHELAAPPLNESCIAAENLIEYQIKKVIDFEVDEHRKRLAEVEAAVNPGVAPVSETAGSVVLLTYHPTDRVEIVELAATSDEGFSKIITVLTALVDEVSFLRAHAENHYYAQLSLFGHSKEDDGAEYTEGVLEAMMGRMLPLFQDCAKFAARCSALALSFVRQVSALHGRVSFAVWLRHAMPF